MEIKNCLIIPDRMKMLWPCSENCTEYSGQNKAEDLQIPKFLPGVWSDDTESSLAPLSRVPRNGLLKYFSLSFPKHGMRVRLDLQ